MYWTSSSAAPMSRLAAFCLGLALWLFVGHVQAQTCSQPSNLSGAPLTPTSIRLSWSGIQGALNYTVQYRLSNSITWTTAPATALTQLTLSGLLPESVYTWRVRANCSTYSSVATFNTGGAGGNTGCSQPSNLNTTPLTLSSVSLSWSAISGAFNYTVQYRVSTSATWTTAPATTATQLTLNGLLPETVYIWRVKASCSTYSSTATFNTGGSGGNTNCSQPSNLNATPLTLSSVSLSWSAIQEAFNYTVQYRLSTSATCTTAPATTATQLTLSGLLPETVYIWRVKASCSTYSSTATFNTGGSGGNTSCSQPSNLNATPLTLSSVSLSWSAIQEAFNYTVQYRLSTSAAWTTTGPVTGTQLTLTGLLAGATYQWRVRASCSTYSSIAIFTLGSGSGGGGGSTSCSAPSNTNTDFVSPTSAQVSWEPQGGALNYTVQYRLSTRATYTTVGIVTTPNATITGLMPGREYVWRVKANCSPYGSDVQFSTPFALAGSVSEGATAEEMQPADFRLFPNPATEGQVDIIAPGARQFMLMEVTGRVLRSGTLPGERQTIDLSGLGGGMYIVRLQYADGGTATQRLMVVR